MDKSQVKSSGVYHVESGTSTSQM